MSYSFPEIKNFQGLFLQQNSFTVPDGFLEACTNAVVSKDGILSKRRGQYTYYAPVAGTLNRLFNYEEFLMATYTNAIVYYTNSGVSPNLVGTQTALSGQTVSITGGMVSRSLQSNENFYFTTDNGVLKLTAHDSIISQSGAPQGLDLLARFTPDESTSWFTVGDIVGYRVVFGYTDANGNLILGAPSDITTIQNTDVTITAGTPAVVSGSGPYTITVNSVTHGLTTGQYVNVTVATSLNPSALGVHQITVVDADHFSYSVVVDPGAGPATVITYGYGMAIELEFSIPSGITTALPWFYQVYRSSQQQISVGVFSDFQLLDQETLTSAQISAGVVFFVDDNDDVLRGAQLYTNENSAEGELQANFKAPFCLDMALYKSYATYANCTTRHLLALAVVDPTQMSNGSFIEIKITPTTRRYVARTGVGNQTVRGTASSSAGLLITYTANGFVNGDTIYISDVVGGSLPVGTYFVINAAANTFKISLTSGGAAVAYGGETSVEFQGVTNGTYPIFYLSQSTDAAVRLRDTAQSIVKAINRDTASLIYAQYVSGLNDIPGKMRFQSKGFGPAMSVRADSTMSGQAFSPVLPASFASGVQVVSTNDVLPNAVFVSKTNEPEAVPLVNFLLVGSKNKAIIRIHALRDSLIVLKEDGVFRITGDNLNNFTTTLLDGTVRIVAGSSSDVLNNQVALLSNQGICLVTESSVQVVSRNIEDVIQPILGQTNLAAVTGGVAYESDRLYLITTSTPNDPTASQVYAYNFLTNAWTTWDTYFTQGVIGPNDLLYLITTGNEIAVERKDQTKIDYTGQNFSVTISNVSVDLMSCYVTMPSGAVPQEGDVIIKAQVINRIAAAPVLISGDTYSVVFAKTTLLINSDSAILYSQYVTNIQFTPFHAGLVGRMKQFSQMQIHLRDNVLSKLTISFVGDTFGGSESVIWVSQLTENGWGEFPWGFEPWGQQDVINLTQGTKPAPIIRTYVPKFQARNTFIQAVLQHSQAAEPMDLQSISYTVRPYGERVSR